MIGAIIGSLVTIPLGMIASFIFHYLFHTNRHSSHLFRLIGMGFGLLVVSPMICFGTLSFMEVVFLSTLFFGSGYLTGMFVYGFWKDHFVGMGVE